MKLIIETKASTSTVPSSLHGATAMLAHEQWAATCAARLIELRPASDPQAMRALAAELSDDLFYFDPMLAAEMEHEGGMLDD